jgi:Beta-galactosidase/beta-glucuronidase
MKRPWIYKIALVPIAALLLSTSFFSCGTESQSEQLLAENWILSSDTLDIGLRVSVPSVVQTDLFEAGYIADPYKGTNENSLLWISNHPWKYSLSFDADPKLMKNKNIDMVFEGLDTYADVYLNGEKLFLPTTCFVHGARK